jgi:nucleoside-diphosphate-sugar epimerase
MVDVGRRVFLTGAGGRLGSVVLPMLVEAGHMVVGVDVRAGKEGVRELNLLDTLAVRGAMEGCDAVVHLGNHSAQGARPPAQLFNENVAMTMNVFDAARGLGIRRIINASTIQVIAGEWVEGYSVRPPKIAYLPLDGESPADPNNSYAMSKLVGEMILAQWATEIELEAVSLRYPYLADFDNPRFQERVEAIKAKSPGGTLIAQGFSWLSYRDAARLVLALLKAEWKGARVYFPAAPGPRSGLSVEELMKRYYEGVPRKAGFEGEIKALVDTSAITRDTGWVARDLFL